MSHVDCCQWQAAAEARGLSFDAGTCAGARISPSGLTIGEPVENVTYADPFGDAGDRNYHVAHWISPQITASFAFHELVASWSATTPPGTWVEFTARVAPALADESTGGSDSEWLVLGRWAEDRSTIRRTSVSHQQTEQAYVDCDVVSAKDLAGFGSWQLRVALLRATGTDATPVVRSVGAVVSRWAAVDEKLPAMSTSAQAWGTVLDVPSYSQTMHLGEYPELNGGGEAWCSPASTAMVLSFWRRGPSPADCAWVDPAYADPEVDHAAAGTFDSAYDGCGNWSFNVAYAARFGLVAYVTRLRSLDEAEVFIQAGVPLVVSVSFGEDELTGAGYSTQGHLLVLVGFTDTGDVVVNDPASHLIASNDEVRVTYDRAEFERAWLPTSGTAYVIHPPEYSTGAEGDDIERQAIPYPW